MLKYSVVKCVFLANLLLLTRSTSDVEFEEDFVHSFLLKTEKLTKTARLDNAEDRWIKKTGYKNAVGISVDNWTNQKLEFPEVSLAEGAKDRWYKPVDVARHTRDIAMLAYSQRGSGNKGSLSYLVEDSWPRTYICLGWDVKPTGVEVVLSVADKHLDFEGLLKKELNGLLMKDKMRFYKGTSHYVVAVTCLEEGSGSHLVLSIVPQNLDVWAWEKYYKQEAQSHPGHNFEVEILPTEALLPEQKLREETESEPGIFERKDLLSRGESVHMWQGNKTERQVMAGVTESVASGIRIENWSKYLLSDPEIKFNYGKQSNKLPLKPVASGYVELVVLEQKEAATGVSAVIRWNIGDTDTVLSLMISVPYNQHLWSCWVAAGLTKDTSVPDFNAMYSGTPDSAWFVRQKMGRRMEFSNGELILVVESDSGTSKPVVRLSVVPLKPSEVATSIRHRLEGKSPPREGREGDRSVLALSSSSSSSQCYCPCMGHGSHNCLCRIILALAFILHIRNVISVSNCALGN